MSLIKLIRSFKKNLKERDSNEQNKSNIQYRFFIDGLYADLVEASRS